ncbi:MULTISPECIES: hypothetical protein [Mesorhizobium]|nr:MULTISPECIES: hypothetical protein [Mesorhizobium]
MEAIFDDRSKAVAHPRRVVRALVGVIALNLAGNLVAGLVNAEA